MAKRKRYVISICGLYRPWDTHILHETDKHGRVISRAEEDALNVHAVLAETCTNLRDMLWQAFINMKHATIL